MALASPARVAIYARVSTDKKGQDPDGQKLAPGQSEHRRSTLAF
jgi:hypothetical protein